MATDIVADNLLAIRDWHYSLTMSAPGWHPDNNEPWLERWWDGRSWTAGVRPSASARWWTYGEAGDRMFVVADLRNMKLEARTFGIGVMRCLLRRTAPSVWEVQETLGSLVLSIHRAALGLLGCFDDMSDTMAMMAAIDTLDELVQTAPAWHSAETEWLSSLDVAYERYLRAQAQDNSSGLGEVRGVWIGPLGKDNVLATADLNSMLLSMHSSGGVLVLSALKCHGPGRWTMQATGGLAKFNLLYAASRFTRAEQKGDRAAAEIAKKQLDVVASLTEDPEALGNDWLPTLDLEYRHFLAQR